MNVGPHIFLNGKAFSLTKAEQRTLKMRQSGMSTKQIAEALSIREGGIIKQLRIALEKRRSQLEAYRYGVTSHSRAHGRTRMTGTK